MSLRVCSIASGSKGNCIFVSSGKTDLIIDLGVSFAHAQKCVKALSGRGISNILLTHCHSDHFSQVPAALKNGATLYYNKCCRSGVVGIEGQTVETDGGFEIGDIEVLPFEVCHDVPCVGYKLRCGGSIISIATDLGRIPGESLDIIRDSGMVILESNYDDGMLRDNRGYPSWLKVRIANGSGHLSNDKAARAVCELTACGVKQFLLAHISEQNNTPKLAYDTSAAALERKNLLADVRLSVALQDRLSSLYEVG